MIDTPYQFKSLASRVRGMHGALDAGELAKLLGVAKVTILRRAKRGKIPSFRIGTMIRFDPQAISRWLLEQGVQSLSTPKRDRKSTRLNSSHVAISYAVFCLKKKIITRTPR